MPKTLGEEKVFEGIPVSPGITFGRARVVSRSAPVSYEPHPIADDKVEAEVNRFLTAVEQSRAQLKHIHKQVADAVDETHAQIIGAQTSFLDDVELIDRTVEAIRGEKMNAEYVFHRRIAENIAILQNVDDEFIRARESDFHDIGTRVLNNLSTGGHQGLERFDPDSVIVAHDLAPSDTTGLINRPVLGFVLEKGGPTSHTAIMAKALEIPAVVGVSNITTFLENDQPVIVDGISGRVVICPSDETVAQYRHQQAALDEEERELSMIRDKDAETTDGYSIHVRANVELPEELDHVIRHGARGIGLFRTEFLFMNRDAPPTEEEQFRIYRRALEAVRPHSVVFRTLDIGGDKFFSPVPVSRELNPFMGQRAVRLCLQHPEIFRDQLRAMLRASAYGRTKILIPMISGLEEFLEVKKQIRIAKEELKHNRHVFDPHTEVGAMIEVPSAALVADLLAQECDFFSIGTNDLIQYTLAVDRGNENVAYLYEPAHPAIIRLLRSVIAAARDAGIPVCVCGEVAADPLVAVLLLGLGVDDLSMSAVSVPRVKQIIRSVSIEEAKQMAEEVAAQTTIEGVKQVVRRRMRKYLRKTMGGGALSKRRKSYLA